MLLSDLAMPSTYSMMYEANWKREEYHIVSARQLLHRNMNILRLVQTFQVCDKVSKLPENVEIYYTERNLKFSLHFYVS